MIAENIYLITGPIHSGKTTRLAGWIQEKKIVDGILQPLINGVRCIQHISSKEIRSLEILPGQASKNIIQIGNYNFDADVFAWARMLLQSAYGNTEWLIIDEVGKLELQGKGLEPAVTEIFSRQDEMSKTNLVVVVRDYLVNSFLRRYNLLDQHVKIIDV